MAAINRVTSSDSTCHEILFCISNWAWLTVEGRTISGDAWSLQYKRARSPGQLKQGNVSQPSAMHLEFSTSTCARPVHSLHALASTTAAHNKFPPTPTGAPFQVKRGSYSTSRALRLAVWSEERASNSLPSSTFCYTRLPAKRLVLIFRESHSNS